MSYADVVEGVRAAIARYTHALDDGRAADVVATFVDGGVFDAGAIGTFEGHDALLGAYESFKPRRPQRHLISNTLLTDWNEAEANATSDVVFTVHNGQAWVIGVVGRYDDQLRNIDGEWKFVRRTATFLDTQ